MKVIFFLVSFLTLGLVGSFSASSAYAEKGPRDVYFPTLDDRPVVGWRENVSLLGTDLVVRSTIDPALEVSSISVDSFEKKGKKITLTITDRYNHTEKIKPQLLRKMSVKRSGGKKTTRYTVMMKMCIGGVVLVEEVGVVERKTVGEQLRLGRNALAGRVFVDPSREFISDPRCKEKKKTKPKSKK